MLSGIHDVHSISNRRRSTLIDNTRAFIQQSKIQRTYDYNIHACKTPFSNDVCFLVHERVGGDGRSFVSSIVSVNFVFVLLRQLLNPFCEACLLACSRLLDLWILFDPFDS